MKEDDEQFIPFIHNYCDRWCERCRFINQCRIGAKEVERSRERSAAMEEDDVVDAVTENLKRVLEHLEHFARENGIDWDKLQQEIDEADFVAEELSIEQTRLQDWGKEYLDMGQEWFSNHQQEIKYKEDELNHKLQMGIKDIPKEAAELVDAIEVIRWFLFFINVKLDRALYGLRNHSDDEEDPIQNDANGSAKVALNAVERSLKAWEVIRMHFPNHTDELIDIFVLLGRIKMGLETLFPEMESFVRPGFDEPELYMA